MDRLKERIAVSQKMYTILCKTRIRSIFHPNPRMRTCWNIIFQYLRVKFYVVLIADYQMVSYVGLFYQNILMHIQDKNVPYFGKTEQVGFSFFSYHLPISIFGLIDVTRGKKYVYITDKYQAGSKSGNHTCNFIIQYV